MIVILFNLGFFCELHSLQEHATKNKLHVFQAFDSSINKICCNTALPARDFILRKSCKNGNSLQKYVRFNRLVNINNRFGNINNRDYENSNLFVITLKGQLLLNVIRYKCECHDFVDDLLLNGIFPSTAARPSKLLLI